GFTAAQMRTALVGAPVLSKPLDPVELSGRVLAIEPRETGVRLLVDHPSIARVPPEQTPARVRVVVAGSFAEASALRPGDWIRLRAGLRPPPGPAAPGAFDFARQAYFARLGAVGFAYGAPRRIAAPADERAPARDDAWRLWWSDLRQQVARRIRSALPGETGAVAAALMTGERGAIPAPVLAAMRDSGLAHLLAISGLHVGLIAGLLFAGLRFALAAIPALVLDYPTKKWAAVGALIGAAAYLELTGATVPTQRAFLMLAIVLMGVVVDRLAISPRLVAWAAVVVLAIAPESLLGASFQLSFAAVLALVAAYEAVSAYRLRLFAERGVLGRVALFAGGIAFSTLVAGLATAPFAIYHFNRVAWFALAANMVAVPVTALWIMPWAVAGFILLPLGVESLALTPMGWGIDAMLATARTVAAWPGAAGFVSAMPSGGLLLVAGGGLWLCLWRRPWRWLGLAGIAGGLLTVALSTPPDVLISGDGRLFAVRTPEGTVLLSSTVRRRFDAGVWRRRWGGATASAWPQAGASLDGRLRCDTLGCVYRAADHTIAFVADGRALSDDCALATIVISRTPVGRGRCPGPVRVIDRFDLWRKGAHALWLSPGSVRVETVAAHRGIRPWTPQRPAHGGRRGR
ncbi:MAG: ComEC/Rec2 family competence protein, partial [Alphaproteobacteria bacterium]